MDFDVLIIGGGPVGASLALALGQSRLRVGLVEAHAPPAAPMPALAPTPAANAGLQDAASPQDWDARIYAISPGSAALLDSLNVWHQCAPQRIGAITDMRVFGEDGGEHSEQHTALEFSAYDAGLSELAYTIENRELQRVLWNALRRAAHVQVIAPAVCKALNFEQTHASLTLGDGRALRAQLIVGADGADSWTRANAGMTVGVRAYRHAGVVANFKTERPHRGVAYQWFRADGVLAYLPLPENRMSMVWSTQDDEAARLLALPAAALAEAVAAAGQHMLGALEVITPAQAFPLRVQYVKDMVAPRLALVGDAAHGVHPLAGQGVNLGLRDVRALAQVLEQRGPAACGEYALLRRYERARREDVLATQLTTDVLQRLSASRKPFAARARNAGLAGVQRLQGVKRFLVRRATA